MALSAKPGSIAGRTRRCRSLYPALVLGVLLAAGATSATEEATHELFEQYEVVTGTAKSQTVLPGFFLGGAVAELVVVGLEENDDPSVRMYAFDGAALVPVLEATLGPGVLFVDVATIDGRDRLIIYRSGRLSWFDPDSTKERVLVEVAADYNATDDDGIPRVDITRDLNRDGRDDLVIPDVDGFWVSTQSSDGSFADAVKLGPPEPFLDEVLVDDKRSYGELGINARTVPWYLSRVHQLDYDHDGRSDLVFWNEDHFDVHRQDARGQFSPLAETFTVGVPFDSDGLYTHAFGFGEKSAFCLLLGFTEKSRRKALHSFRDMNGDGVADLVTHSLEGRSLMRQRSVYEVHYGTVTADGTVFARDVSAAIQPRAKGSGALQIAGYSSQKLQDFDGDGQIDVMFRSVKMGIGGMTRALVGNSVALNLEFYRGEDGVYADEPTTRRRIRRFAPFAGVGNVFFPAVLMGDVNGDGRADLVVGRSPRELHVFLGESGPDLLARQPRRVAVASPHDERNTWLVDLNKDGKQDLLMHRTPTSHAPAEPHRLTTLIAR